jgi:UTP--glucose-1-phosphate uridylyltransferase
MAWMTNGLRAAEDKMRAAGQHEEAIGAFRAAYERLAAGESGLLPSAELEPADGVLALEDLPQAEAAEALRNVAVIKLNGGLATTMGLRQPKSLVEAREGHTFLDIIAGQARVLRERAGVRLPLLLMNSDATESQTLDALAEHPELDAASFMQSMEPKLDATELSPVSWPADPGLEWCPPGHGDVYGALRRSGALATLLEQGLEYAMISNSDNLGATVDPRIAQLLAKERIPFLMEVVVGTVSERKGGHIARRRADGQLVLRETAQTPPEDEESFRDYKHWRYYNTNNLWVDLRVLADELERREGVLALPLIVNRKTVDPRDPSSPPVLQLESAMGAAIASFPGARVLRVPRTRFAPVKTTDDLLVLRSDVYALTQELTVAPQRQGEPPFVELEPRYYKLLDQFEARFPAGAPSLREADRLVVHGDVTFEDGVVVRGTVELAPEQPERIPAGTILSG